jgi:hypothetical protein
MKFAKNRMYIESYTKCPNCGILIYENAVATNADTVSVAGARYCSTWCVEWEAARGAREKAEASAQ